MNPFVETLNNLTSDTISLQNGSPPTVALEASKENHGIEHVSSIIDKIQHKKSQSSYESNFMKRESMNQFQNLQQTISSLKDQTKIMQNVLEGEKGALTELEQVQIAALQQAQMIQYLERYVDMVLSKSSSKKKSWPDFKQIPFSNSDDTTRQKESMEKYNVLQAKMQDHKHKTIHTNIPSNHNLGPEIISIPLIKQVEYENLSKYVRSNSKISLAVLNEAVLDIVRVCRLKYTILFHYQQVHSLNSNEFSQYNKNVNRKSFSLSPLSPFTSPSMVATTKTPNKVTLARTNPPTTRSFQQHILSEHYELDLHSDSFHNSKSFKKYNNLHHNGRPWVSEESLRDSCTFFRFGEVTSRAILSSLRSLGRLKQINNKSRITYVLLMDSFDDKGLVYHSGSFNKKSNQA